MLRRTLFAFVVLLTPAATAAQSPDDRLIVPGVRIGTWHLAMTVDELIKLNGPEVGRGLVQLPDMVEQFTLIRWPDLSLAVATIDGRQINFLALGIGGVPAFQRTAEGVGAHSPVAAVLKAYGTPSAKTVPRPGQENLIYDQLGINFQVVANDRVLEVRLFKPGTAGRIWRF